MGWYLHKKCYGQAGGRVQNLNVEWIRFRYHKTAETLSHPLEENPLSLLSNLAPEYMRSYSTYMNGLGGEFFTFFVRGFVPRFRLFLTRRLALRLRRVLQTIAQYVLYIR